MSEIILQPTGAGSVTAATAVPGARANWECVEDYPEDLETESYVYSENNPGGDEDLYDLSTIVATQRLNINSVSVRSLCSRENDTQVCSVQNSIRPAAATSRDGAEALTTVFTEYVSTWNVNPETDLFWTVADVNAMEAGQLLLSGGALCEARCTQLYVVLDVSVLGEFISNYSPFYKDVIHVDQGFSVIAEEDYARALWGATTLQIRYKDPGGTEANLTGDIIDENRIIAPLPAATNNQTGKWWFKLYAVLAGGEILEGKPFFVNVQPRWL